MLVLTRRVGEKIVIGNETIVEVLSISGEGVRLGIVAPNEISIHRYEVFVEIQAANQAAFNASTAAPRTAIESIAARFRQSIDETKTIAQEGSASDSVTNENAASKDATE